MSHAGFLKRLPALGAPAMLMAMMMAMAAVLGGCLGEKLAGSTTTGNTGKGTISGRVLNAKGEGVANARVRVVSADHNPGPGGAGEVADVVLTAADGTFRTDSLTDGLYNLLDEKAGELSFRDSVAVDGDSAAVAEDDVLKPPGSLAGVVRLQPGHDSRTVFLILLGTTTLAFPMDSVGNFRLANLAEGEYRLRILSTLDAYKPMDTVVTIVSGVQGILQDTLRLAYKALPGMIPDIESLQVAYDSIRIAATLTWRKADPSKAVSYCVYRKHRDSAYVKLNRTTLSDTAFVDNWTAGLTPGNHYAYAVTAVDARGDEGRKTDGVPLIAGVRYRLDTRIPAGGCIQGHCEYDVDAAGDIYVSEADGTVVRYGSGGWISKRTDPHPNPSLTRPIVADAAGGAAYMLYILPPRIGKVDSAGRSVWIKPLPFDHERVSTFHKGGDSLYVWSYKDNLMTYLDLNGEVLGQDTLMRNLTTINSSGSVQFKTRLGFFWLTETGITFLDRDGHSLSNWNPEMRGRMTDVDRDAAGRWFLSWESGVIDVFSPERVLLGPILTGGGTYGGTYNRLKFAGGAMYMATSDAFQLFRIDPGF